MGEYNIQIQNATWRKSFLGETKPAPWLSRMDETPPKNYETKPRFCLKAIYWEQ